MSQKSFLLSLLLLRFIPLTAQTVPAPYLVKNITQIPDEAASPRLIEANGTLYFTKISPQTGIELWKSDGTLMGSTFIKQLSFDAYYDYALYFLAVGNTLYFNVLNYPNGGLWKTDGTAAGTVQIKELATIQGLTLVNSTIYFGAAMGEGQELWKSDGTAAGTILVKDINPGGNSSTPKNLTNVNGILYFSAENGTQGRELWKSDGTAVGTVLVKDIYPGSQSGIDNFPSFCASNGQLFLLASNGMTGKDVWKSDGTEVGTSLVKDLVYVREELIDLNGLVLFAAQNDNITEIELWKTNGTTAGTTLVKDISPQPYTSSDPANFTKAGSFVYFSVVNDSEVSSLESLWRTDGSAMGTIRVTEIRRAQIGESFNNRQLGKTGNKLFFSNYDSVYGDELWQSDGTTTSLITDIRPGPEGSAPRQFIEVAGSIYFIAFPDDGFQRIHRSDGTGPGTSLAVNDLLYTKDQGSVRDTEDPTNFTADNLTDMGNGVLFFTATDNNKGFSLFKTDGTAGNTVTVKNFGPYVQSPPRRFTNINGTLYFAANDGTNGEELWKSDGTAAGTIIVKNIYAGSGSSSPNKITAVNGTIYFIATHPISGRELWKTDGTEAGTLLVKDIYPGSSFSSYTVPLHLTNLNGTLYFTVSDGVRGRELYKSDGTAAGTVLVKDINPGNQPGLFSGSYLINVNGVLYFNGYENTTGYELWKSDGTEVGTVLVKDINPGSSDGLFNYPNFTFSGGTLFFQGQEGTHGAELWKSDGTEAGTLLVKDIEPGVNSSNPNSLVDVKGTLFFSAYDIVSGKFQLWRSNGLEANTTVVKSITDNAVGPYYLTSAFDRLYFGLRKQTPFIPTTYHLWQSDGTESGTVPLSQELRLKNIAWSTVDDGELNNTYEKKILVPTQNKLYFFGDNSVYGMELWAADKPQCTSMYSLKSGSWHDSTLWSCGRIPIATDVITVTTGHVVSLSTNGVAGSVELGGTLSYEPGVRLDIGQ